LRIAFDPILDLLTEAEGNWDGKKRLDTWVVDYLGLQRFKIEIALSDRKVLIAGCTAAHVYPGCKFDNITVLEFTGRTE